MNRLWSFASRNLTRNKRRNLATGLSVMAGALGLNLLGGYILYAHVFLAGVTVYNQHTGHFSVLKHDAVQKRSRNPRAFSLTPEDVDKIKAALGRDPHFDFVGEYLGGQGLVSNGCDLLPFLVSSLDPVAQQKILALPDARSSIPELVALELKRDLARRFGEGNSRISITPALRKKLKQPAVAQEVGGTKSGGRVDCANPRYAASVAASTDLQLLAKSYEGDLSVVDVDLDALHSTGLVMTEETGLMASTKLVQDLFQTDRLSSLGVFLKPGASIGASMKGLRSALGADAERFDLIPYNDDRVGLFYTGSMGFLFSMGVFFFILVLMVVTISIFNTATLSIYERRREIGTLKSLGWNDALVLRLFVAESFLLALGAVFTGVVGSIVVTWAVNAANLRFKPIGIAGDMPFKLVASPWIYLSSGLLVAIVSLVISRWTVSRLIRGKPIDLLGSGGNG